MGFSVLVVQVILALKTEPVHRKYVMLLNEQMNEILSKWDSGEISQEGPKVRVFFFGKEMGFGTMMKKIRIPNTWKFYGDFHKQTEATDDIQVHKK